jgi:hypothetical protein
MTRGARFATQDDARARFATQDDTPGPRHRLELWGDTQLLPVRSSSPRDFSAPLHRRRSRRRSKTSPLHRAKPQACAKNRRRSRLRDPDRRGNAAEESNACGQHLTRQLGPRRFEAHGLARCAGRLPSRLDSPEQTHCRVLRKSSLEANGDSRRDSVRSDARQTRYHRGAMARGRSTRWRPCRPCI